MINPTLPQDFFSKNSQPNSIQKESDWNIGEILLGTYEVKGVISQGGMGVIHLIHHLGWGLDLAVKSPRTDRRNDPLIIDNYFHECEIWIDLGLHPNIVTCYYVRNIGGIPRIFSEYIQSGSLKDWISTLKLYSKGKNESLETILDIAIQVAWGLDYSHKKKVIHQDVKPSNILINENKVAKVTDFGVSRARGITGSYASNQETIFAPFGGMTPEYCSPEQANKVLVSRKTDIWSWGVSVLEMFTGEATWMSGVMAPQVLSQYLVDDQIPDYIPKMPKEISELLSQCFEIDPEKRPEKFDIISNELVEIYNHITGHPYGRRFPENLKLLADSLNNQGVSLWDLENHEGAYESWDKALIQTPLHPQATYNKLLTQWRSGQVTDQVVIENLEAVSRDFSDNEIVNILIGDVHLERGDIRSAGQSFQNISDAKLRKTIEVRQDFVNGNNENSRCLKQRLSNSTSVIGIKFSDNDHEAITVSGTKNSWGSLENGSKVQFWNLDNGNNYYSFQTPDTVSSVSFSHNRNTIVTGRMPSNRDFKTKNYRDKINIWDLQTGQKIKSIDGFLGGVTTVEIGSDGVSILAGGYSKEAGIWDANSNLLVRELKGHSRTITCGCFTGDMKYCFTGEGFVNLDGLDASCLGICIKMWKVSDGSLVKEFIGHQDSIRCICINNDDSLLGSSSDDGSIKIWDIATGNCITTLIGHTESVNSVIFVQNDSYVLSAGSDNTVRLWNLVEYRCIYTFEGHANSVNAVAINKDNDLVLSGGGDSLILWSSGLKLPSYQAPFALCNTIPTETQITSQDNFASFISQAQEALRIKDYALCVTLIRAARNIPSQTRSPEAIKLWQSLYQLGYADKFVSAWQFEKYSDDQAYYELNQAIGKKIALKYVDRGRYQIIDISTRRIIREIVSKRNINRICLSPDATYAFTAEGGIDDELAVWNLSTGSCLRPFTTQRFGISSCEFDHSSKYVITGGGKGIIKIWDIFQGKCVQEFIGHKTPVNVIFICQQSRKLITGSGWGFKSESENDNTIKVWDIDSGRILHVFDSHTDRINCFSVSQKEDFLFSASNDCKIKMWDLRIGKEIRSFDGHQGDVTSLDLSPNQKYLVSGSQDKSIILWNIQDGEKTFISKFDQPVTNVSFSKYGEYLLITTMGNVLYKYFIDWEQEVV